jgi:hypothetical protein
VVIDEALFVAPVMSPPPQPPPLLLLLPPAAASPAASEVSSSPPPPLPRWAPASGPVPLRPLRVSSRRAAAGGALVVSPRVGSRPEAPAISVTVDACSASVARLPLAVLQDVFLYLDGASLARAEGVCVGFRDAVRGCRAWPGALRSDLGPDEASPRAARALYRVKVAAYRHGVAGAAAEAAAAAQWARLRGPRRAVARSLRAWHYMCALAPLGPLAFTFVCMLALRVDGRVGYDWYRVFGVAAALPGAILLDGLIMAVALVARGVCMRRPSGRSGGSVLLFVKAEGPWFFLVAHTGVKRLCAGAWFAGLLSCLVAWAFAMAARAAGDATIAWAAACAPLWAAFFIAAAWPVCIPDSTVRFALTTGLALWAAPTAVLLPAAVAVAAYGDGAGYTMTVALTSVWIFFAGGAVATLAVVAAVCRDVWRKARSRRLRVLMMAGVVLIGLLLLTLATLSPILIAAKLDGVYTGTYTAAATPALLVLSVGALGTAILGAVGTVDTNDLEPAVGV